VKRQAVVAQGDSVLGIQSDRLADEIDGGYMMALLVLNEAQQVERAGVVGIAVKNLAINLLRLTKLAVLVKANGIFKLDMQDFQISVS
jgi:hypothetical protein